MRNSPNISVIEPVSIPPINISFQGKLARKGEREREGKGKGQKYTV